MGDFRSEAEIFVSNFLDYIYKNDILDHYDKQTNKMVRSAGVEKLIRDAKGVFPARANDGQTENEKLSDDQKEEAIKSAPNVVDTREMFARRVARNGGTHKLLRDLYAGTPGADAAVAEFLAAEDGEKEFAKE